MTLTKVAPRVSAGDFKHAKIIATIGPATNNYEAILSLIKAGVNGFRLNFSHGTYEERAQQVKWIRQASDETSKPIAIIQDLQGPKVRLGDFEGVVPVQTGQDLRFRHGADYKREGVLPTQYDLSKKVKRGERIYLFDGKVLAVVTSVKDDIVHARAHNDGILISRKGINLPDTDFGGDVITNKDRKDIAFATEHGFDYIALSFVQTAEDIKKLRRILHGLASDIKIIAKIETKAATENLEEIIQETDVAMVARGDLAVETELAIVPILQRKIVNLCLKYAKPSIVATQMMASMVESPEPTRAEISDIAAALMGGADALMLSDETAVGKYPIKAVKIMRKVIALTEAEELPHHVHMHDNVPQTAQNAISCAIIQLADNVLAAAIVAETKSGATAIKIAAHRPKQPIIVVTSSQRVAQQLAILFGAVTFIRKDEYHQGIKITDWLRQHHVLKNGDIVIVASGQHPGVVGTTDTIKVRVLE